MDLLPAIDIRNGHVVRLRQGEAARQTVYGEDPLRVAEQFVSAGARWIHLVDLDRAFAAGDNLPVIRGLVARVRGEVRVQLGGGLRSLELIREGLELGVSRVVLGTAAALDAALVPAALELAGVERLAVGIDSREGRVAIRGWTETSPLTPAELCRRIMMDGVRTVIYTDIGRDGMLAGPDVPGALELQRLGARVIASGGISSLADIRVLCEAGLAGAVVGRALYDGRFSLEEALQEAACGSPP